ncbi:hypothetical protein DFJ58DRAFT_136642 [Suillus subalutaceus]|uniref:uncharacterized protein n=1 Tax=Suillus subalutaceus TaxID=48586 RepID=UPI001B864A23|nr:uncharacterized protein DFJ58DRAFT_136642 [Suillus subalutaceus]KAG1837797.1 hypothetical protein DFJ58DRAFT_136642 [Suillus subalutaceus]
MYVWDICGILKQAGFENLLSLPNIVAGSPLRNSNAARRPAQLKNAHRGLPGFFDDAPHSSATRDIHHRSSARRRRSLSTSSGSRTTLFSRIPALFRHSRPKTGEAIEFQQHPRQSIFSRRSHLTVEVPAVQDRKVRLPPHTSETTMVQYILYSRWLSLCGQENEHSSSIGNREPRRCHR